MPGQPESSMACLRGIRGRYLKSRGHIGASSFRGVTIPTYSGARGARDRVVGECGSGGGEEQGAPWNPTAQSRRPEEAHNVLAVWLRFCRARPPARAPAPHAPPPASSATHVLEEIGNPRADGVRGARLHDLRALPIEVHAAGSQPVRHGFVRAQQAFQVLDALHRAAGRRGWGWARERARACVWVGAGGRATSNAAGGRGATARGDLRVKRGA